MKIALQMGLLPGATTADKARWARDQGVDGLELGTALPESLRTTADEINGILPITSVCGNSDPETAWSFHFLDPDHKKRRASIEGSKAILTFCGEAGAVGQIVPPIFGGPLVPDLSPLMDVSHLDDELMLALCRELGPHAAANKTLLMLEPLNRYEQHYLRRQADGVRVIQQAGVPGIGLLSDLFHMHIEETDTPRAIIDAGSHISHLHLADNTRLEPGTGDIDFVAAFRALHQAGFTGYMAFECGISGETAADKEQNLIKSLAFVRDCIGKARR